MRPVSALRDPLTLGAALTALLLCGAPRAETARRTRVERTSRTTRSADGTVTTVVKVRTTTSDGRTTTSRTVTTRSAGPPPAGDDEGGDGLELGAPGAGPEAGEGGGPSQGPAAGEGAVSGAAAAPGAAVTAREALAAHNRERQRAGRPPLAWSEALRARAADWARHLCRGGRGVRPLEHRPARYGDPGENLWQAMATGAADFPVTEAVAGWAAERRFYNPRSGACTGGVCGHYTQLIWGRTREVGCAAARCPAGSAMTATVWVCNYAPAGNVMGERP